MNDPRIPALLVSHQRPGFYFRVLEEGEVQAGDEIVKVASGPEQMTVAEVSALLYLPSHPRQQLLRVLRIPALSPGWQTSFQALLDGEPGSGNAGLIAASPPPAWPGFRRLAVTAIERESDSVISIRLEDPDGAPLPAARPGQYLTLRIQPDEGQRSVLRNYSLSGPPDAGYYRITVKREHDGAASGYLHSRLSVGDQLDIAAPRGTFILDRTRAPVLLISAGIGATPVLAMLQALAKEHSEREIWWLHGARSSRDHSFAAESRTLLASLPNVRTHVYYSRPGPNDLEGRDFDTAGRLTASLLAELEPAARCPGIPVWPDTIHGRDQRRSGGDRDQRLTHPHRAVRTRSGSDARNRRDTCPGAPPTRRLVPETARRSSSPAATSPSRGAATTPACSSSPKHATYPSDGRAAPASATTARPPSSPATSNTAPTRSNPPPTEAHSSAAHSHATTWCSTCDWQPPPGSRLRLEAGRALRGLNGRLVASPPPPASLIVRSLS